MKSDLIERIKKEIDITADELIRKGIHQFLLSEYRNISLELTTIYHQYNIQSFEDLWSKLERGEISESQCFNDLPKLEYLEAKREKIANILKDEGILVPKG